jgi:hypothetical protein
MTSNRLRQTARYNFLINLVINFFKEMRECQLYIERFCMPKQQQQNRQRHICFFNPQVFISRPDNLEEKFDKQLFFT